MNGEVEAEAVFFYRFQLPLSRKFAASIASPSASAFTFLIKALPNAAFYPRKKIKKAKTSAARPEFLSD